MSEIWEFLRSEQCGNILTFLGLATTIYFTKTLVENDNKREKRSNLEKEERKNQQIIEWCINDWKRCGSSPGLTQTTGNNLVSKFGQEKVSIIIKSYEVFANQNHEMRLYSRSELLNLMRTYNDKNKLIWPEN